MTVHITPLNYNDNIVELSNGSNIFEKQVLPYGQFNYKGKTFEITEQWLDDAIKAFEDRAFDQVVFALADENNSHNVDERPDRYAGEILKFVKKPNGLSGIYKLNDKAASLVRDNKKLGVSVRFHNGYTREADGKSWPVVIDQVLGTLNPRITGMDPWKEIALSNITDRTNVEDSSNGEWEMTAPNPTSQADKDIKVGSDSKENNSITLTRDEYDKLKKLLANPTQITTDETDVVNKDEVDKSSDDKKVKEPVGLSNEAKRVIELSRDVAVGRYERDALAWKQAGVPPAIIELAAPVLSSYEKVNVISLSNGVEGTVDAREVVRNIIEECKGMVCLSEESGHSVRGDSIDQELETLRKQILKEATEF